MGAGRDPGGTRALMADGAGRGGRGEGEASCDQAAMPGSVDRQILRGRNGSWAAKDDSSPTSDPPGRCGGSSAGTPRTVRRSWSILERSRRPAWSPGRRSRSRSGAFLGGELVHGDRLDATEVDPAEGLLGDSLSICLTASRPGPGWSATCAGAAPRRSERRSGRPSCDQGVMRQPIEAFELGPHRGRSGRQRGTTAWVSASRIGRSRARRTATSWAPPTPSPRPSHRSARPGRAPATITATVRSRAPAGRHRGAGGRRLGNPPGPRLAAVVDSSRADGRSPVSPRPDHATTRRESGLSLAPVRSDHPPGFPDGPNPYRTSTRPGLGCLGPPTRRAHAFSRGKSRPILTSREQAAQFA